MTNQEYQEFLKKLDSEYSKFTKIAKKIKQSDKSEYMESLKSQSILAHIKLRATLQKFRKNSCGCEYKKEN